LTESGDERPEGVVVYGGGSRSFVFMKRVARRMSGFVTSEAFWQTIKTGEDLAGRITGDAYRNRRLLSVASRLTFPHSPNVYLRNCKQK